MKSKYHKEEQTCLFPEIGKGNNIEKKVNSVDLSIRPARFWDAWNSAKKFGYNNRRYHPGQDFEYANGKTAKEVLSDMFPNETKEIAGLNAAQAKRAYYEIRGVYFG